MTQGIGSTPKAPHTSIQWGTVLVALYVFIRTVLATFGVALP